MTVAEQRSNMSRVARKPQLRTRKPTGLPSWPMILLAGEAKVGKTFQLAQFTGDERLGRCFYLDLGEGCGDEYIQVPGADYELIEHDGTWIDIIGQVEAVVEVAQEEYRRGGKPVLLGIDSMTAEWAMLSQWTDSRARKSQSNRKLLTEDPDAEIDITSNYWNDANGRHYRLMNLLKTAPMITVMTALESEKTQFGSDGRPIKGAPKVARPDAQKRLTADATAWIRLSHDHPPTVIGIRSVKHNVQPGVDKPRPWAKFTLGALVFDVLGIGSGAVQVRDVPELTADAVDPGEAAAGVAAGTAAGAADRDAARPSREEVLDEVSGVLKRIQARFGVSEYDTADRVVAVCRDKLGVNVITAQGEEGAVEEYDLGRLSYEQLRLLLGELRKSEGEPV